MLIRNQKVFNIGLILAVSFVGIFILILSPIFGNGRTGLQFSDDLFNKLSKGSSYFIPDVSKQVQKFDGNQISVAVKVDKPEQVEKAIKILMTGGAQVGVNGNELSITADLGKLLSTVVVDSDAMYKNDGSKVSARYGIPEKEAMSLWWSVLNKADKELKKQKKVEESNAINDVLKKAVEPAFNYYGIQAESVASKAGTMTALLVFYVAYTLWYGYAIFYMFDGIGLSMKKSKVKKEV